MPDTVRTRAELQALFPDNASGLISAQDLRDFLATTVLNNEAWPQIGGTIVNYQDLVPDVDSKQFIVPAGKIWRLANLYTSLTTRALPGARLLHIELKQPPTYEPRWSEVLSPSAGQDANLTRYYVGTPLWPIAETVFDSFGMIRKPLPQFLLASGGVVDVYIINVIDPDDDLLVWLTVEEATA